MNAHKNEMQLSMLSPFPRDTYDSKSIFLGCVSSRHLDHEVLAEAPARLGAFLSERAHVIFKAAQVLREGHEEEGSQFQQQGVPGLL